MNIVWILIIKKLNKLAIMFTVLLVFHFPLVGEKELKFPHTC